MLGRYLTLRPLLPLAIVLVGYRARFLNLSGCLSALLVGTLIVEAGWTVTAQLVVFFFLGSVATKVKQKEKEREMPYPETQEEEERRSREGGREGEATKTGETPSNGQSGSSKKSNGSSKKQSSHVTASSSSSPGSQVAVKPLRKGRDMYQVFATGLIPALICAFRHSIPPSIRGVSIDSTTSYFTDESATRWYAKGVREDWYLAYGAFLACCLGDTLASEVGMLSNQTPIMLWGRKLVRKGTDGGMTLLGTGASIVGGTLIGACSGTWYDVVLMATYGCIGGLLDSLMGTFLQSAHLLSSRPSRARASTGTPAMQATRDDSGFLDVSSTTVAPPLTTKKWKHLNALVNVLSALVTACLAIIVQWAAVQKQQDVLPILIYLCLLTVLTVIPHLNSKVAVLLATVPAVLATATKVSTTLSQQAMPILVTHAFYAVYRLG